MRREICECCEGVLMEKQMVCDSTLISRQILSLDLSLYPGSLPFLKGVTSHTVAGLYSTGWSQFA